MRTHGLTDPVIALRRQTDYQFSPNWLSGAEAMNSGSVLAGTDGFTNMTSDCRVILATGAMSRLKLKFSLL
jgi:hypothetical protein